MAYDVVVVGAGPGGAAAAADLAGRGYRVILLDRKSFPRDKPCGGGITPGAVEFLNGLGAGDKIRAAGFYPINAIRIGSPYGRTWETRFRPKRAGVQFYVVRRDKFDSLLVEHAVEAGAEFQVADVKGFVFENGRVVGVRAVAGNEEKDFPGRVVVAADGTTSAVARALLPGSRPPAGRRAVAVRAFVEGLEVLPHKVEFYFKKYFLPGYAWIFPMGGGRANVGVIARADGFLAKKINLEDELQKFLGLSFVKPRLAGDFRIESTASWQLAFAPNRPLRRAFDGALLVGDAGLLADPLTGEGVRNALCSARLAAGVISGALDRNDTSLRTLARYDKLCDEAFSRLLKRSNRLQKWVTIAPWWVDLLFLLAKSNRPRFHAWLNRMSTDYVLEV